LKARPRGSRCLAFRFAFCILHFEFRERNERPPTPIRSSTAASTRCRRPRGSRRGLR
jgi:hypothetical protein